jgi:hypothetical protein
MLVQQGYTNNQCRRDLRYIKQWSCQIGEWREGKKRRAAPATANDRGYADRQDDPQAITISGDAGAGS